MTTIIKWINLIPLIKMIVPNNKIKYFIYNVYILIIIIKFHIHNWEVMYHN